MLQSLRVSLFFGSLLWAGLAVATDQLYLNELNQIAPETLSIRLTIDEPNNNFSDWNLPATAFPVFYRKLQEIIKFEAEEQAPPPLLPKIANSADYYHGVTASIRRRNAQGDILNYELVVFNGHIKDHENNVLLPDYNRELEFWLFGAHSPFVIRKIAARVLPVISFNQCKALGNPIIYTSPVQCLMPDDNIFLDVPEQPTQDSIRIKSFAECLEKGQAIIQSFPRRCLVAGGHVFVEPARIPNFKRTPL